MTLAEYMQEQTRHPAKRSKYRNKPVSYAGVRYQSTAEGKYAQGLDLAKYAKSEKDRVVSWKRQVKFDLTVGVTHICNYILDFEVNYADGRTEYIDVKGYQKGVAYQLFTLKKRLAQELYGITIIEYTGTDRHKR